MSLSRDQRSPKNSCLRRLVDEVLAIGELGDLAAAMDEHDGLVTLVDIRVLDQAGERREAGAGREQQQALAREQVAGDQRAGRLAADQDDVAFPDVLQARGQRAVLHLDAEEFERLLVIGAGHAVGAQQRLAFDLQADHRELAVLEAEARIARGREAEQACRSSAGPTEPFPSEMRSSLSPQPRSLAHKVSERAENRQLGSEIPGRLVSHFAGDD